MASEPPDLHVVDDDELFEPERGQGRFRRSCLTVAAAVLTAGGLMVGCTAVVVSRLDDMEFHLFEGWDFSGLSVGIGCDGLDAARTQPDPAEAEKMRAQALQVLYGEARYDATLAEAFRKGYFGVEAWCNEHEPD